jgi:hypothetical protein
MMRRLLLFVFTCVLLATPALPRSSGGHTRSTKCASCVRDSHGKIRRSAIAKKFFRQSHPCPSTGKTSGACSGYVIDHTKALKRGGLDEPGNMQWQTVADAKAKGRIE